MELFCEVFDKKGSFQVPPLLVLLLEYATQIDAADPVFINPWCYLVVEGANDHAVLRGCGCDSVILFGTEPTVRPAVR